MWKAEAPMVFTDAGSVTEARLLQSLKASAGISVSEVKYCSSSKLLMPVPANDVPRSVTAAASA